MCQVRAYVICRGVRGFWGSLDLDPRHWYHYSRDNIQGILSQYFWLLNHTFWLENEFSLLCFLEKFTRNNQTRTIFSLHCLSFFVVRNSSPTARGLWCCYLFHQRRCWTKLALLKISYTKTDRPDYKWLRVTKSDYEWLRARLRTNEWIQVRLWIKCRN